MAKTHTNLTELPYKKWIYQYLRNYWYMVLILLFFVLIVVILELASPLPLKFLADNVFGKETPPSFLSSFSKEQLLLVVGFIYLAINGLQTVFAMVQAIIQRKMNQSIDKSTMSDTMSAALITPYNHEERADDGTYLYQITNQSQQMSEYLLTNMTSLLQASFTLIGIIIVLAKIDLRVMLITFISMPLLAICIVYFGRLLESQANDTETAHGQVYGFVNETLKKLRTVQAFALEGLQLSKLRALVVNRNKYAMRQLITDQFFDLTTEVIILSSITLAIIIGGRSVLVGAMTFGDLIIFISYTNNVFDQISSIAGTVGNMREQQASLRQAYSSINLANKNSLSSGTITQPIVGKLQFHDITISRGGKVVLENINLTIGPHSMVAFVGESGGGKTTIYDVLERFVTPDKGWVTIDEVSIKDFDIHYLRRNIALLEQEPNLFNTSVGENIALAAPERPFSLLDITASSVISNSQHFIDSMQDKYNTLIDNHLLSGGQKQRIALARAHYKNAPIILMDEPTSALDKPSAIHFRDSLLKAFNNKTVLVITHDLSLLEKIPNIYVVGDKSIRPISEFGGLEQYGQTILKDSTNAVS